MDEQMMTEHQANNQDNAVRKRLTDGVRPRSVARLLAVTLDPKCSDEGDSDETVAELLQARLAGAWLADSGKERAWSKLVRQVLRRSGSNGQRTLGGILLDPQAQLGTIKQIRDRAKARAASEDSEARQAVMTTIYFAAIANALAYRGARITTYSYGSLESSFEKLIRKSWMPAEFVELFRRARKACQKE
jgi:hypothetical protein